MNGTRGASRLDAGYYMFFYIVQIDFAYEDFPYANTNINIGMNEDF
jgi:hypothetical protein